jgi:membrane protease YdiL (CAAX protease family)
LRWAPFGTSVKSTLALIFAGLALYAIQFAATAGFYLCFRPGPHPARRILWCVSLPAIIVEFMSIRGVLFGPMHSFAVGRIFPLLLKFGPGLYYGGTGIVCVTTFAALLALGRTSLPLSLPKSNISAADDPASWNRVEKFLWVLLALIPLVLWIWFPTVMDFVFYYLIFVHFPAKANFDMALFATKNFATDMVIAGIAVWMTEKDTWNALRRSFRWPAPGEFALAVGFPVGIAALISIGELLFDVFRRAVHPTGGLGLSQIQSYFALPRADMFWFLLVALSEEFIFRGLLQPRFVRRYGPLRGIFLLGIVFAAMHLSTDFSVERSYRLNGWLVILMMSLRLISGVGMSFVAGWFTLRTGSVLAAAVAHGLFDVLIYSALGPGLGFVLVLVIAWAGLACVLFRYWPVQAEVVQETETSNSP